VRILGVDHGTKRIGLAISDETGTVAQPLGYATSLADVLKVQADQIVVGIPRRLDGTESEQTRRALRFIEQLKAATKLPVIGWDERLTTAQARRALIEGNVRREKRKQKVDQLAAQLMLQSYLDAQGEIRNPKPENRTNPE
jgi:putative Holliday junction resolvase